MSATIIVQGGLSWRSASASLTFERVAARLEVALRRLDDVRGAVQWVAIRRYCGIEGAIGYAMQTEVGFGGQCSTIRATQRLVASDVRRLLLDEFGCSEGVVIDGVQALCTDNCDWSTEGEE